MFASVQIVGSAQDSVIGERRRTCGRELGVKGPQVQILSSRRETAGQRPFRTKSEAASLLPCSHWCSNGARSRQPIAAESRWTKERAPSVETAARRYAVAQPPRACARQISDTAYADRHRSFPNLWLPLVARSAS